MGVLGSGLIGFGGAGGGGLFESVALYSHHVDNNTDGGTVVANTWTIYPLDTVEVDLDSIGVLDTSQLTLQAGSYLVAFHATLIVQAATVLRLRDVTHNLTLAWSVQGYATGNNYGQIPAGWGHFVLADVATLELQYYSGAAHAVYGLGTARNYGEDQVYGHLIVFKES